ncbi:MAG: hypothetical protein IBX61_06565 [Thermoleophilia bacterium]|nr:hypothetical protein [Thermoleophilia bacterium]
MKTPCRTITLAATIALALAALSCGGDDAGGEDANGAPGSAAPAEAPEDRAARVAAQTQLRNAQSAQEAYFQANRTYAASSGELAAADPRLSRRVVVERGDETGYEMSIEASDSAGTTFILRKQGARVERIDGGGKSW